MKILYIGQYQNGSTSKMRAEQLKTIIPDCEMQVIDTSIPFDKCNRISRSIGFRYKIGPVIKKVNDYIYFSNKNNFDLIWVDKGVYLTEKTTKELRLITKQLIHFTPDPAFTYHKSHHFRNSLKHYDFAITTKSYETDYYNRYLYNCKLILCSQGFDLNVHKPYFNFEEKTKDVLFIGHYEKQREIFLQILLDNSISVGIAGNKWLNFVSKNMNNSHLHFLGKGIHGDEYSKTISEYMFSWGAISKWIPEKHTTRTFEIPACGTALITERNEELLSFFNEDEVIFYSSEKEIIEKIKYYYNHLEELEELTERGYKKVTTGGYDYKSILEKILIQIGLI